MKYDLIIIGAGPAGLSAALDAAYLKLKTLVIEAHRAGGALVQSYPWKRVDSYLGLKGMTGKEVAERIIGHVRSEGVRINDMEEVEQVHIGKPFVVETSKGKYECSAVIFATGIRGLPRRLGIPGEDLKGVEYSLQDPKKFRGKAVAVFGGGDSAVDSALGLESAGAKVWLAHRRNDLRALDESKEKLKKSGVKILWNTELEKITGKGKVEKVVVFENSSMKKTELKVDSVLISIGSSPSKVCLERIGIKMDGVCASVDENGMTSVPGIFAAGDIVSSLKRIPQALATGEKAAYSAYKYIKDPYWK